MASPRAAIPSRLPQVPMNRCAVLYSTVVLKISPRLDSGAVLCRTVGETVGRVCLESLRVTRCVAHGGEHTAVSS